MSSGTALDAHRGAYTAAFAHFEENRIVHEAYGRRIAERIVERGAQRVLSMGIGHTEVARPIVELLRSGGVASYTVVDAAPAIIEGFRAAVAPMPSGLALVEGWFERVEFDTPFDLVEAGFILEHVDDPAPVLRRLHAFLAPGALVCVAVPNARSLHHVLGHEAGLLPDLYALSDADRALGHQRYFDVPRLETLAADCGFRVERRAGLLLKPFTTGQLAKLDLTPAVWQALQRAAEPYPEISNAFCMELSACA